MAIGAQSQDRGEQSLLELPPPQPAGLSSRELVGDNQPSMRAEKEIARVPAPREDPSGERHIAETPPERKDQDVEQDRKRGDEPRGSFLRCHPFTFLIGLILFVAVTTVGYLYWDYTRHFESTDDAFIAARQFPMAPKVSGYITAVPVTDNQHVAAGDVIARIDDRDYRIALDQAGAKVANGEASIQNIDAQLSVQEAQIGANQAQLDQAQAALVFARQQDARYEHLAQTGWGTIQNAQQYSSQLNVQEAAVQSAQANLKLAQRQIEVLKAQRSSALASLAQAKAQRDQAQLDLSHTIVTADQPGRVVQLSAAVGAYAQAGTALTMFVPDQTWVTANFKEIQLDSMRPGQEVTLEVDAYPERTILGHVDSIQPGSGTAFSLLPAQNATGNYVKIVQRVPVKLVMDNPPSDVALGPGMSVVPTVRVDPTLALYERLPSLYKQLRAWL